jgi:hypothetical protein
LKDYSKFKKLLRKNSGVRIQEFGVWSQKSEVWSLESKVRSLENPMWIADE